MNFSFTVSSVVMILSVIGFLLYSRIILPKYLPKVKTSGVRPVMFIKTDIESYSDRFSDLILFPKWLRDEWKSQMGYAKIKFKDGEVIDNILIQKKLNDILVKSEIKNLYFSKNEIVAIEEEGKIFSLGRFKEKVGKLSSKPIIDLK